MDQNKAALSDVMEVGIFDKNNRLITELKETKNVEIKTEGSRCFIKIKNALYDTNLLKFMGRHESVDDLSSYLSNTNRKSTISLGGKEAECKVVTKTILHNPQTNEITHSLIMEFPDAKIISGLNMDTGADKHSPFDLVIEAFRFGRMETFSRFIFKNKTTRKRFDTWIG